MIVLETADVDIAVGTVEGSLAFQLTVDEVPAVLVAAGVAALALAIGFAVGELALVGAAVFEFEAAEPGKLIGLELAAVGHAVFFEGAFTVAPAQFETAVVTAAVGAQGALAVEQPLIELPAIDLAIAAVPFTLAVPLAFIELTGVPAAIRVVDPALALQQAIDHVATIASAVRQPRIRGQQRFAISASGEHQGQGNECK